MKPINRHLKVSLVSDDTASLDDAGVVLPNGYTVQTPWVTATVEAISTDCQNTQFQVGNTVVFPSNMLVEVQSGSAVHNFIQENYIICYEE